MPKLRARFQTPTSLMVGMQYEGFENLHMAAHLALLGHALLRGDLKAHRGDGSEPVLVAEFPRSGEVGLVWSWSGLANPEEQLTMFGYCLLAKAFFMWGPQLAQPDAKGYALPIELPRRGPGRFPSGN